VIEITIDDPCQLDIVTLLAASDASMATLCPAESNHMLDAASLQRPEVTFVVAREKGRAVDCGATHTE